MGKVLLGMLLPGSRIVGDGINQAKRAPVATARGEIVAIIKELPQREVVVEIFCALLGRELGLPIPEPLLVADPTREIVLIGSVDVGYPSLHQPVLAPYLPILSALLKQWPQIVPAACFDEWIANPDRHGGNLLFDGIGFWLIDHGLAMRCEPADSVNNHLMTAAVAARTDDLARQRLKREIDVMYQAYTAELMEAVGATMRGTNTLKMMEHEISRCLLFLPQRLLSLSKITALRIRTAQGDLEYDG